MNETLTSNSDIMFILAAIAASFVLGGAYRLGSTVMRERRAVELTDQNFRALTDRYESQQRNVTQLTRELSDVRQALMQQAMALGPVHALRAPAVQPMQAAVAEAAAPAVPVSAAPVSPVRPAPVQAVPASRSPDPKPVTAAARPAPQSRKPTPQELARAGASADQLMSRCGLSRAEAELVVSVHGKQARTAA